MIALSPWPVRHSLCQRLAASQARRDPVTTPAPVLEIAAAVAYRTCRWPLWGERERPTHQYCDAPVVPGRPYCATCCARARPIGGQP